MKANKNKPKSQPADRSSGERSARKRAASWKGKDSEIEAISREFDNPVNYDHPYSSMKRFAEFLALRYDCNRTRHAYYRQMRLLHEHFQSDPAELGEDHLREYFLYVKLEKQWFPKTIRQCRAAMQMFYLNMLGREAWTVFSQVHTRDHDLLPAVLTREEVHRLLGHIRLRRYRTPLKLIYCCGLRLSECLELTIHDILGHKQINSTMIYLHVTHQTTQDALRLMDDLCKGLPR